MKLRHRAYLKLNLMSLFFIAVSFISITLAWFAYSGLAKVSTEIDVKAWYIELEKDGETVSNKMVISLSDIYPGMETVEEKVNIKNLGDSDAQVKYSIVSARILNDPKDNYIINEETTSSPYVEDILSHEYPFHININLSKGYVLSGQGDSATFEVSISWPLDSDNDSLDSLWGTAAYQFEQNEKALKDQDSNYQIRPSIQVVISVTAEQYLETETTSDIQYNLGDTILFDVMNNEKCTEISPTCIKTYVMDVNNKLGDDTVTLFPDPMSAYLSGTYNNYNSLFSNITTDWMVNTRPLLAGDILKIVSIDVINSVLIRNDLSNMIIGNLNYNNRMNTEINRTISYNGHYNFVNEKFGYLSAADCYWTNSEYDVNNGFAVQKINADSSKIYREAKTTSCKVIPVIVVSKTVL